jgi:hypothetical protein
MLIGNRTVINICTLCMALSQSGCLDGFDAISNGTMTGQVLAGSPVEGAQVQIWQLGQDGERLERLFETATGGNGHWSVDIKFIQGPIEIEARGGVTVEPWAPDVKISSGAFRAVIIDYVSGYPAHLMVTPYTTIAAALGEAWLDQDSPSGAKPAYRETMRAAYQLLGQHLGGVTLFGQPPMDTNAPVVFIDESARHALMIAALSTLAERIARAASPGMPSAQDINTVSLAAALEQDARDGVLDGRGPDGLIRVGPCDQPSGCTSEPGACVPAVCELDSNTLRAELATALAFDFLPSPRNWTGRGFNDLRSIIEAIWTNDEPRLFGDAPIEPLGGELPVVVIQPTQIYDETLDTITFTSAAEPIHTVSGPPIVLDDSEVCSTVRKYVNRMDAPTDNPLHWEFQVIDRRGVGIKPGAGEYRVGIRGQGDVTWLTDWQNATQLASVEGGYQYEIRLTRSMLPELATTRATFQLELRGMDTLGQTTLVSRPCWEHVPLAAPLWVSEAREVPANDPRSLHSVGIGKGLAPLLNGVPLSQGKAIMEFEIKNGTDDPVYVTLDVDQSITTYTKSWQKTNAELFPNQTPSHCLRDGRCTLGFPPDFGTTIATDISGAIDRLVHGVWIEDMATGEQLVPCPSCDATEYRIEPRNQGGAPRTYRVSLMVTDLSALAPRPVDVDHGPYSDVSLDPDIYVFTISGRRFTRLSVCFNTDMQDSLVCTQEEEYVHYLALSHIALMMDWLRVTGRTRATTNLPAAFPSPQSSTFGLPVRLGPVSWSSQQTPSLPESKP